MKGVRAKKGLGQHFLTDLATAEKIVLGLQPLSPKHVIEIGPGEGVLTQFLVEQYSDLQLIELDAESVIHLNKRFPKLGKRIVFDDFLTWKIPNKEVVVVGNFPYNISSQIVFRILDHRDRVKGMVGMFQKEVAERIVAPAGSKTYGILSVLTQAFYEGEYLFTVDENAFRPPPKVKSGVIRLTRKTSEEIDVNVKLFYRVVKLAFNQRRKMLRNSLKALITDDNRPKLEAYLTKRPEQLTYVEFVELTRILYP